MKPDRVKMWPFTTAPKTLQSLHRTLKTPDWLVFVPRALSGLDLDGAILHGAKPGQIARYETPNGDIVFIGTAQIPDLSETSRPSAMAATHARRK